MQILECKEFVKFIDMCDDAWKIGWHEINGGNASHRLLKEDLVEIEEFLNYEDPRIYELSFKVDDLKNDCFLVTGSGKMFKNVKKYPEESIAIIQINENGDGYRVLWGLSNGGNPTMELSTHLMTHNLKKITSNHRTVLHSHTPNINALTFVLPLESKVFSKELWEMITECSVIFPKGVGVLDWMVCGSDEIGEASLNLMKEVDIVIWAFHGTFCSGSNTDDAFGLMHTVEKASDILVKVISMGGKKQKIEKENIDALAKRFNFEYRKDYFE